MANKSEARRPASSRQSGRQFRGKAAGKFAVRRLIRRYKRKKSGYKPINAVFL